MSRDKNAPAGAYRRPARTSPLADCPLAAAFAAIGGKWKLTILYWLAHGEQHFSGLLRRHDWFHYSGDYRIGTRYLDEHILDLIKGQAMQVPFLRDLLRQGRLQLVLEVGFAGCGEERHLWYSAWACY